MCRCFARRRPRHKRCGYLRWLSRPPRSQRGVAKSRRRSSNASLHRKTIRRRSPVARDLPTPTLRLSQSDDSASNSVTRRLSLRSPSSDPGGEKRAAERPRIPPGPHLLYRVYVSSRMARVRHHEPTTEAVRGKIVSTDLLEPRCLTSEDFGVGDRIDVPPIRVFRRHWTAARVITAARRIQRGLAPRSINIRLQVLALGGGLRDRESGVPPVAPTCITSGVRRHRP